MNYPADVCWVLVASAAGGLSTLSMNLDAWFVSANMEAPEVGAEGSEQRPAANRTRLRGPIHFVHGPICNHRARSGVRATAPVITAAYPAAKAV